MRHAILSLVFAACAAPTPAPAPEPTLEPRAALEAALATCKADEECLASLQADEDLLGSCPWYDAIGCSAVVAAAVAVCVDPETMELCTPALEAVKAIGCCDCLPKGWVRDACKGL